MHRLLITTLLVLSGATPALVSAAEPTANTEDAPPPTVSFDFWMPGEPAVLAADLGYERGDGPAMAPPLRLETRTALFRAGNPRFLGDEDKALLKAAKDLADQGQGAEAVAAYEALVGRVGQAEAEVALTNLHNAGKAGLPKDPAKGLAWLTRASEVAPPYFYHLGRLLYSGVGGLPPDPEAAARAWSRGVRHGCGRCATSMLDFWFGTRQGVTVPDADAFAYAVWAADLGSLRGLPDLEKLLGTLAEGPRRLEAAAALAERAKALAGTLDHRFGGLAVATFSTYRTGLVNGDWEHIHRLATTGESRTAIGNSLGVNRFTDRQFGPFLALFVGAEGRKPMLKRDWGDAAQRMMESYALSGGVLSYAALVARQAAAQEPEQTLSPDGKIVNGKHRFKPEEADLLAAIARAQGIDDRQVGRLLADGRRTADARDSLAAAQGCVRSTVGKARQSASTKERRQAIHDLRDTGSFQTACSIPVRRALALNPNYADLKRWHADLLAYQAKVNEGIARAQADFEADQRRREAARQATPTATPTLSSRSTLRQAGSGPKPCRWKTYHGYGGGRVCVTE